MKKVFTSFLIVPMFLCCCTSLNAPAKKATKNTSSSTIGQSTLTISTGTQSSSNITTGIQSSSNITTGTQSSSNITTGTQSSSIISRSYSVTWLNYNGDVLKIDSNVKEGTVPSYDGSNPVRPDDDSFSYAFSHWDPAPTPIYSNKSFTAQFKIVDYYVTGVSINKDSLSLGLGYTEQLFVEILPNNATNRKIVWTSDNQAVATVEDGFVTPVSSGTTKIRATAQNGKFAVCDVTVKPTYSSFYMKDKYVAIQVGNTINIPTYVLPADAKEMTWEEVDDTSIAEITKDGLLIKNPGVTTYRRTSASGQIAESRIFAIGLTNTYPEMSHFQRSLNNVLQCTLSVKKTDINCYFDTVKSSNEESFKSSSISFRYSFTGTATYKISSSTYAYFHMRLRCDSTILIPDQKIMCEFGSGIDTVTKSGILGSLSFEIYSKYCTWIQYASPET